MPDVKREKTDDRREMTDVSYGGRSAQGDEDSLQKTILNISNSCPFGSAARPNKLCVCVCVYRTIHSVIILDSFDSFSNLRTISANLDYNRAGHIIRQATHVSSGVSQDPEEAMEVKTVVRIRTNPDICFVDEVHYATNDSGYRINPGSQVANVKENPTVARKPEAQSETLCRKENLYNV